MGKQSVVITNKPFQETIDYLEPHCRVVANTEVEVWGEAETMAHLRDAVAMMAFMPDRVGVEFLQGCPRLKVIGAALKGYDNFDVDACTRHGVWLTFVPDLLTVPTAELTVGLTISLTRQVKAADHFVRSGEFTGWTPRFYGQGIEGSRIGIVGMGAIGQAVAQRLNGWGADLIYSQPERLPVQHEQALGLSHTPLKMLLAQSDIVILALALNEQTLHTINRETLTGMKPGAFLINPCRGSVVDEGSVLQALQSGQLGGYAADVFEMEDWAREDRPR
jgi:phosphonate dehydrogenase